MTTWLKSTACLIPIVLLSTLPCRALLGETLEQCIARYGQPTMEEMLLTPVQVQADVKPITFKKDGRSIIVFFVKEVVGWEGFIKGDRTALSDKEVVELLQADSAGGKWIRQVLASPVQVWHRVDGAVAILTSPQGTLTIQSKAYGEAEKAAKAPKPAQQPPSN